MKLLEKTFVSGEGGYSSDPLTYILVDRTKDTAVYQRLQNGKIKDYEVFNIKILAKGTKIFSKIIEEDEERYPATSQFGFSAWSYNNKLAALHRFKELNKDDVAIEPKKEYILPNNEFTVTEVADLNKSNYISASNFIKECIAKKKVQFVKEVRRQSKGKLTKVYKKI